MLSLLDPKPIGAFIEYTLKPILDEVKEVLELASGDTRSLKHAFYLSVALFVFDKILTSITTLAVTGVLCWTALRILSGSPLTAQ